MQYQWLGIAVIGIVVVAGFIASMILSKEKATKYASLAAFISLALVAVFFVFLIIERAMVSLLPVFVVASVAVPIIAYFLGVAVVGYASRPKKDALRKVEVPKGQRPVASSNSVDPIIPQHASTTPVTPEPKPAIQEEIFVQPAAVSAAEPIIKEPVIAKTPTHIKTPDKKPLRSEATTEELTPIVPAHKEAAVIQTPVQPEPQVEVKPKVEPQAEVKPTVEPEIKREPAVKIEPEVKPDSEIKREPEATLAPKPEVTLAPEPAIEPEIKPEPEPEIKPQPEPAPEPKPEIKPEPEPAIKPEPEPEPEAQPEPEPEAEPKVTPRADEVEKSETKPEPKKEQKSQTELLLEKADRLSKKGEHAVAARLFEEVANQGSGSKDVRKKARFGAMSSYVKAGNLDKAKPFAQALKLSARTLSPVEQAKIEAVLKG